MSPPDARERHSPWPPRSANAQWLCWAFTLFESSKAEWMATGAALLRTSRVERESNPDPRALLAHLSESFTPPGRSHPAENNRYPYVLLAVCRPVDTISSYSVIKPIHDPAGSKMVAVGGRHPRNPETPERPPRPRQGSQRVF